jgi:RsiW-degrading membrane proteinase PrsW (M82 family)
MQAVQDASALPAAARESSNTLAGMQARHLAPACKDVRTHATLHVVTAVPLGNAGFQCMASAYGLLLWVVSAIGLHVVPAISATDAGGYAY